MTARLPHDLPLAEERIDAFGLSLLVRIWGDRNKPPVILQHGGKDHGRSWDWTVAALAEDYCLIVPDLRGHGDSDHAPGGIYPDEGFLADFALVMELAAAQWSAPPAIVGHSLGGNIALRYAGAYPERVACLCAIEGLGYSQAHYQRAVEKPLAARLRETTDRRLKLAAAKIRHFQTREEGIERMTALHDQLDASQARHLAIHALKEEPAGFRWKHDPMLGVWGARPVPPAEYLPIYEAVTCPVLLIYGTASFAVSPRSDGRLEAFKKAELIEYEGASHWLQHDRFGDFVSDLSRFLKDHYA